MIWLINSKSGSLQIVADVQDVWKAITILTRSEIIKNYNCIKVSNNSSRLASIRKGSDLNFVLPVQFLYLETPLSAINCTKWVPPPLKSPFVCPLELAYSKIIYSSEVFTHVLICLHTFVVLLKDKKQSTKDQTMKLGNVQVDNMFCSVCATKYVLSQQLSSSHPPFSSKSWTLVKALSVLIRHHLFEYQLFQQSSILHISRNEGLNTQQPLPVLESAIINHC